MRRSHSGTPSGADTTDRRSGRPALGPALRRAWVGYQQRLDAALAAAGFADRGFPDGRVLRMCREPAEMTISQIGRELGITRQGAGKMVAGLRDRGYVTVDASATSGREKIVRLTARAEDYLVAQRKAARNIERRVRAEVGADGFAALTRLLVAFDDADQPRMRDYIQSRTRQ